MEIIPAILTSDPLEMDAWLRKIRDSKKFSRVQVDFIDGEYVANKTFKPMEVDIVPYVPLKFDAHLMVTENNIVEWSVMAEKFGFDRIIAQMEKIARPKDFNCLALDLETPVEKAASYLNNLNLLVLMSVRAGYGGQEFDERVFDKIRAVSGRVRICVDGGVEKEHLKILEELGVDEVAVGVKRVLEW